MSATTAVTEAEAFVQVFGEYWGAGGPADAFVERFTPLLRPDVRLVQPQIPTVVGHEAFRTRFAEPLFALLPDARGEVLGWAARDDRVYIELEVRGHVGRLPWPCARATASPWSTDRSPSGSPIWMRLRC